MRSVSIVLLVLLIAPAVSNSQTTTSEYQESPVTGPETWSLKGFNYIVEGTGLLEGKIFIVRAIVDHVPSAADRSDAINIAQFALVQGYRANSQRFRFLDQFAEVDMGHIGVALIYRKSDVSATGFRFMFTDAEILGKDYTEGKIDLPASYSKEPSDLELAKTVWNKLANAEYEELYNLMSAEFRSSMSFNDFKVKSQKLNRVIEDCELQSFSHFIFIGHTKAGATFNLFYWVQNTKNKIYGLLTVEVGDRPPRPKIVGLDADLSSFYKR